MQHGIYRVLFLSRRNSARSVMAEAILNKIGKGRFQAVSAAVDPAPVIEPTALELLRSADYPIERGGSVCLNSFGLFVKWISASIMLPPSLVPAR